MTILTRIVHALIMFTITIIRNYCHIFLRISLAAFYYQPSDDVITRKCRAQNCTTVCGNNVVNAEPRALTRRRDIDNMQRDICACCVAHIGPHFWARMNNEKNIEHIPPNYAPHAHQISFCKQSIWWWYACVMVVVANRDVITYGIVSPWCISLWWWRK